jgi:hypothetical protein
MLFEGIALRRRHLSQQVAFYGRGFYGLFVVHVAPFE